MPFYQGASEAHEKFQAWPLEQRLQLQDTSPPPKLPFQGAQPAEQYVAGCGGVHSRVAQVPPFEADSMWDAQS